MTSPLARRVVDAPITALAFLASDAGSGEAGEEYILVGEDTQLKVYEVSTGALRLEARVFRAQAVHGIRVAAGTLLIWGARSVAVCAVSMLEGALRASSPREMAFERGEAKDWIYDGLVGPGGESGVLVTAHNEVVEVSWGPGKGPLSFGAAHSPSGPILYAARARWLADGSVLVAGGTAFGEILVWTCRVSGARKGECRVSHVLAGHDGSIFGVDVSDEIRIGGRTLRLLASCSDDRTIRVWDISDASDDVRGDDSARGLLHEARETGFGYNAPAVPGEETEPEVPIAMAMGHISRIWDVKFPPLSDGPTPSTVSLYSFGEDSTAQAWDLDLRHFQGQGDVAGREGPKADPDALLPATLTHRATFSNHDGKHVWAAAMSPRRNGACGLATGGADGKVSLIEDAGRALGDSGTKRADGSSSLAIISHETLSMLGALEKEPGEKKPRHAHDALQRYAFIAEDTLLAVTRSGKLLIGSLEGGVVWTEVAVDAEHRRDLKTCCAVASPSTGVAVLGTRTRAVYLYADGRLSRLGSVSGMTLNLIPLGTRDEYVTILLTVHDNPEVRIFTINLVDRTIASDTFLQGVDERFVLTAAAQFHGYLVIGSFNGFMEVHDARDGEYTRVAQISPRSDCAITTVQALPGQTGSLPLTFLTTHRDGKYRIYELDAHTRGGQRQRITTRLRHEIAPPFGPQIEDAWFLHEDGAPASLILSGFRSKDFIVWNETAREYLAVVDCGGAHRAFAHTKSAATPGRLHFAFTKVSRVHIHSQTRPPSRTIKAGSHGREVRAIASAGEGGALGAARYLATGSEDTTVRVWQRLPGGTGSDGRRPFRCVASMAVHTTGLQCVKWCGDHLLSSGGNENFFVWRVSELSSGGDFSGLAVFCEAAFSDKTPDGDLRITDFDVEREEDGDAGAVLLKITMAFSNSVFKTYRYTAPARGSQASGTFESLGEGEYTGACLTHVRHLARRPGNVLPDVITASTDGHIALWTPVDGAFALTSVVRVHQSSIKSLDLRALGESAGGDGAEAEYLVTTTGDDNAMAVTALVRGGEGSLAAGERTVVASAHAAAITGVVELPGGRVATVSNDQRLKVWEVGCGPGGRPGVRLVGDLYSGVADPGAVGYIAGTGEVVVGGVGMEVWGV